MRQTEKDYEARKINTLRAFLCLKRSEQMRFLACVNVERVLSMRGIFHLAGTRGFVGVGAGKRISWACGGNGGTYCTWIGHIRMRPTPAKIMAPILMTKWYGVVHDISPDLVGNSRTVYPKSSSNVQ
ncbi:MAG: hypothetical protein HQL93_13880 [Magnetococcales bacterium]|nr:hypothetical protein [Magnetococcales bacterium]